MTATDLRARFLRPGARRVVVLGHPGHELGIYGLLQQQPPEAIVVVTDGGGPNRVAQSQEGLRRIGLLERARYLDFREDRFYSALLEKDVALMRHAVEAIREALLPLDPDQVLCDAVEFYNPLHDITLPLVRAALAGHRADIYEIPLVYQVEGPADVYVVQRVPEAFADRRVSVDISTAQMEAKQRARDLVYVSLHEQAGPRLLAVSCEDMAREELALSAPCVAAPGAGGRAVRYERRARLLRAEGRIERMITYADHFAPMLDALGVARAAAGSAP